jgi:hypothetical protein
MHLLANLLPDDARHLVPVELDDGVGDLDLGQRLAHGGRRRKGWGDRPERRQVSLCRKGKPLVCPRASCVAGDGRGREASVRLSSSPGRREPSWRETAGGRRVRTTRGHRAGEDRRPNRTRGQASKGEHGEKELARWEEEGRGLEAGGRGSVQRSKVPAGVVDSSARPDEAITPARPMASDGGIGRPRRRETFSLPAHSPI